MMQLRGFMFVTLRDVDRKSLSQINRSKMRIPRQMLTFMFYTELRPIDFALNPMPMAAHSS